MSQIAVPGIVGKKLEAFVPPISNSTQIDILVHLLDIIIKAGKHFPVISISLTGLNFVLAVNDFLANNMGFAIMNSIFVIGGLIFFVQTRLEKVPFGPIDEID